MNISISSKATALRGGYGSVSAAVAAEEAAAALIVRRKGTSPTNVKVNKYDRGGGVKTPGRGRMVPPLRENVLILSQRVSMSCVRADSGAPSRA